MIEQILRRQVSTLVATIAVSALGAFSLAKLPLSLLPAVERPRLVVTARAQAASRDQMVHDVTEPLERRLALVAGVASIESETSDGEAKITVEAAWQADADRLRVDVARRIEGASRLPLDELSVDTAGSDLAPVIEVAVAGGSAANRATIAQRVVLPELARIDGAGKIETIGAAPLRVFVEPRIADLSARGLTAHDIEQRLQILGRPLAAGRAREGAAVRPVVVLEPIRSTDDLRRVRVAGVPLGEVANIGAREMPDDSAFRMTDPASKRPVEGVLLRIGRAPNANAVALARAVRERILELGRRTGEVKLRVVADRSREVSRALLELAASALLGILLGTFVLRFALGHWRPTMALSVVVPVALLVSFTVFYFAGISLDVISLAGLALATGLLVDNSIVVLESIESARAAGEAQAVVAGTKRIVTAVVASSVTLIIVFAPLLYLRGLARALFGEQALAVVASVGASLLLSLSLTPVLAARERGQTAPRTPGREAYLRLLDRAFEQPLRVLLIAALVVAGGIAVGLLLPRELFARGSTSHVIAEMLLPPQADPAASRAIGDTVWKRAAAALDSKDVASMQLLQLAGGEASLDIELTPRADADAVVRTLGQMQPPPGVTMRVRPRPSAFIEGVAGDSDRVEIVVSAAADGEAAALTGAVSAAMTRAGFRQRDDASTRARNALAVSWNEQRLAANHVDRASVEQQLRSALGGIDAGQCEIPRAENSIRLLPAVPAILPALPVRIDPGRVVPLAAIADIGMAQRSAVVRHDQGRPARRLSFDRAGADPATVLRGIAVRRGERIRVAGHQREMSEAFAQMRIAFVLAVILLYLTVAAFYDSLVLPLLVMTAIPFAAAGAMVALVITGQSLNVMSLIGLVLLGGIVVNHTVVLLDRAEQLRRSGVDEREAVLAAAKDRYRPVLMTTVTAILGMLPLALLGGEGVELRRAIAIAVTGGLVTATIGTLLVIPVLHAVVEPYRRRRAAEQTLDAVGEPLHA